jgi:uncharacterized Ntn-hydrolase superfamily protein
MTFSLVGRCARTGMLGVVVTSSSPAVAARCAWARAGVGAASTQNITDPSLGPRLLDLLAAGRSAPEAVQEIVSSAPHIEFRQLSAVDAAGGTSSYSGPEALGRFGTAVGVDCVAAGNLLASEEVLTAMVDAFETSSDQPLGGRLLTALGAGAEAGGEEGPVHSAGLLVVDRVSWPVTDLRVDWSEDDPIGELADLWQIWHPQAEAYVQRALDPSQAPSYGVPGDE